PPHRDLLLGLPDRRSRPGADPLEPEGPAAPDAVGSACAAKLVRGRQHLRRHRPARVRPRRNADRRAMSGAGPMTLPRLATFTIDGKTRYGAVTDRGVIDLSARHGAKWPDLRDVIEAGALARLGEEAAALPADFAEADIA